VSAIRCSGRLISLQNERPVPLYWHQNIRQQCKWARKFTTVNGRTSLSAVSQYVDCCCSCCSCVLFVEFASSVTCLSVECTMQSLYNFFQFHSLRFLLLRYPSCSFLEERSTRPSRLKMTVFLLTAVCGLIQIDPLYKYTEYPVATAK
jgi:hypothetical protein